MELYGLKLSTHCSIERADRLAQLGATVGFGELLYRMPSTQDKEREIWITSTAIAFVVDVASRIIVTGYQLTLSQAHKYYGRYIPKNIYKSIVQNQGA